MSLPIFALIPDSAGYTVDSDAGATLSTKLRGGLGMYRADQLGASSSVTATFTCNPLQYQYCRAFYRRTTGRGSLPFQLSMILEQADLEPYKCYFASSDNDSGFRLQSQVGQTYVVSASLEVVPLNPSSDVLDDALVSLYGAYGDTLDAVLARLAYLVNVQLLRK